MLSPCQCLDGFNPVDRVSWEKEDFSEGWYESCSKNDKFEEVSGIIQWDQE